MIRDFQYLLFNSTLLCVALSHKILIRYINIAGSKIKCENLVYVYHGKALYMIKCHLFTPERTYSECVSTFKFKILTLSMNITQSCCIGKFMQRAKVEHAF